jgi:predicted neutral ceramidase superfamily lipid hydrolase
MKDQIDLLVSRLAKRILLVLAVLVTLCIAVDGALHTSHIMVFFSLIILSALFYALYVGSEKHKLGVSLTCLVLGSIYLAFYPLDFTWWRFSAYSGTLYLAAILFFASWLLAKHWHRTGHTGRQT